MNDTIKIKYRDHRELLDESMKTVQEFSSKKDLINYLQKDLDQFGKGKYDLNNITIKSYGIFDKRIGWDTYIVCLENFGVLGFTNGNFKEI